MPICYIFPKSQLKNIPNETKYAAKTWKTSNGTFKKTHSGNLELMFPAFYKTKLFSVCLDIVIVDKEPMVDSLLGIKTLPKVGTILDF